jgi:uncharacterized protein YaaR (DUF327 family)
MVQLFNNKDQFSAFMDQLPVRPHYTKDQINIMKRHGLETFVILESIEKFIYNKGYEDFKTRVAHSLISHAKRNNSKVANRKNKETEELESEIDRETEDASSELVKLDMEIRQYDNQLSGFTGIFNRVVDMFSGKGDNQKAKKETKTSELADSINSKRAAKTNQRNLNPMDLFAEIVRGFSSDVEGFYVAAERSHARITDIVSKSENAEIQALMELVKAQGEQLKQLKTAQNIANLNQYVDCMIAYNTAA